MDMNLHSVRGDSKPSVVLYQSDLADPLNPLGLLIAYAEESEGRKRVKPVCSDFDTFTVGSRGAIYEPVPPNQLAMVTDFTLPNTQLLLENDSPKGWMVRRQGSTLTLNLTIT